MDMKNREIIVQELKDKFLPLDYGAWQADELLEQVFAVILNPNHVLGNDSDVQ